MRSPRRIVVRRSEIVRSSAHSDCFARSPWRGFDVTDSGRYDTIRYDTMYTMHLVFTSRHTFDKLSDAKASRHRFLCLKERHALLSLSSSHHRLYRRSPYVSVTGLTPASIRAMPSIQRIDGLTRRPRHRLAAVGGGPRHRLSQSHRT